MEEKKVSILRPNKNYEDEEKNIEEKLKSLEDISYLKKSSKNPKFEIVDVEEIRDQESLEKEKTIDEKVEVKFLPIPKTNEEILEVYELEVDKAKVKVEIKRELYGITYNLHVPALGVATASLLGEIRDQLVSATTISMKEIVDPYAFNSIKQRFMEKADTLIKKHLPNITPSMEDFLIGKLMQDMLGLGEIEFLVSDPNLEEIVILSSKEPIRLYHKKYGWMITNLKIGREDEIINYSNIIARRVGKQITVLSPLLDAHLVSGDRVNSILYPICSKGNTITIRKFARDPYTIVDLIANKTCSLEIAAILWLAIEYEMNVLISGGTASGKTVLLNACMPFIPPNHRIISVEDTRELMLPEFLYWCPLVTRTPNSEGKGEISMLDLLVNCLRMRPDRIILGEMRRQQEAMVLFEAMHTGHSVYATLHANSATETISRLINPPLSVPANLLNAVNLNVVMFRDRRRGIRRVIQVAEFECSGGKAEANLIYRWIPEQDKIVKHGESSRFFEDIGRNTGMDGEDLEKNLEFKRNVLTWLVKRNIRDLESFGKVINYYYMKRDILTQAIQRDQPNMILGVKK
jgi:archaeal flagellar protein FlaI